MLRNDQLAEWDRENFFHPSTHLGEFARGELAHRVIAGGTNCHIEDRDCRVFFDPADKIAPQIAASMASHGVIARAMPQGDIMGFAPPFCLTRQEADQIVETMVKAVKSTLG
jgi:adenosylmethionine-8-amino-7-oxononanoate aminotransferase